MKIKLFPDADGNVGGGSAQTPPSTPVTPAPTPTVVEVGGKKLTVDQIQEIIQSRDEAVQTAQQLLDDTLPEPQQREVVSRALKMAGLSQAEIEARLTAAFRGEATDEDGVGSFASQPVSTPSTQEAVTIAQLSQQIADMKARQAELERLAMVRSTERIETVFNSTLDSSLNSDDGLGQVKTLLKKTKNDNDADKVITGVKQAIRQDALQYLMEVKNRDGVVTEAAVAKAVKEATKRHVDTIRPLLTALKTLGTSPSSGVWENVLNRPKVEAPPAFVPGRDSVGKTTAALQQWAADLLSKQTAREMLSRNSSQAL